MFIKYFDAGGGLTIRDASQYVLRQVFGTCKAYRLDDTDKISDFEIYGLEPDGEPIIKDGCIDYTKTQTLELRSLRSACIKVLQLDHHLKKTLDDGAVFAVYICDPYSRDICVEICINYEIAVVSECLDTGSIEHAANKALLLYEESKKEHLANHE